MDESIELTERQACLVLNALPNIGPITLNRLRAELGANARAVFRTGAQRLEEVTGVGPVMIETLLNWRKYFDLDREEEGLRGWAPIF